MNTKLEILKGLNDDQKQPVINYNGPRIVVAGPGSGRIHVHIKHISQ